MNEPIHTVYGNFRAQDTPPEVNRPSMHAPTGYTPETFI